MRRLARCALTAATVAALAGAPYAAASASNVCNGQIDTDCDYYDSQGNLRHCDIWLGGGCPSVTIAGPHPRGTCDGGIDVDCSDPNHCNLWVATLGCVIG
jgi:hypothetical protein